MILFASVLYIYLFLSQASIASCIVIYFDLSLRSYVWNIAITTNAKAN